LDYQCLQKIALTVRIYHNSQGILPHVLRLGLALPRLAVEVLRRSILDRFFLLGKFRRFHERLVEKFFLSQDTTNGLVVDELGELEEQSVEDSRLRLLVGLE
jgi:hypothetical protein